ncbi:MAG: hypothetical protein NVS1B9_08140 [Solirubrobacteraceae bacterium]
MPRPSRILLLFAAGALFLLISALLARYLSVENAERDAVLALLRDEGRGDAPAMLARLRGCGVPCVQAVRGDAARLRGSGELKILNTDSATAYSLTGGSGVTRVAWKQGSALPVVQCIQVKRSGNVLTGLSVTLLSVGGPIAGTADCPSR